MFVSDGASLASSEVTEADNTGEEALAKLSLTQVTREGDEDTVRRLLELYNRQNNKIIDSLDDSKVNTSPHSSCSLSPPGVRPALRGSPEQPGHHGAALGPRGRGGQACSGGPHTATLCSKVHRHRLLHNNSLLQHYFLDSRSAPGPHLRPARGRPSW